MDCSSIIQKMEAGICGPTKSSGIYGIFIYSIKRKKEKLVYIGSSKNVYKRVTGPKHPYRLLFDKMHGMHYYVYTKYSECQNYSEIEKTIQRSSLPLLNKRVG